MRRADHAGCEVGEQNRHAIRGQDAEQQPRPVGHERVGMRPRVVGERADDRDRVGRMNLIERDERAPGATAATASARLAAIAAVSSAEPSPTLRPAWMPLETPPCRPRNP